jgi:hypothetical protein
MLEKDATMRTDSLETKANRNPHPHRADGSEESEPSLPDIKPRTTPTRLDKSAYDSHRETFDLEVVAPVVGLSPSFIRRVAGGSRALSVDDVLGLLELDAFQETFVRRSQVIDFLLSQKAEGARDLERLPDPDRTQLHHASVLEALPRLQAGTIQCVVTSTPYWAMRLYKDPVFVDWADGESCPYGHEQTPEGFVRHTTEILYRLVPALTETASVWWNVMDSYNTRTQIRGSAAEALRAMQGRDKRGWHDHECRRYSHGHAFLKDGEQCMIPAQIAQRASRIGYFVKSVITWNKDSTMPEPQNSRVSRNLEYVVHLSRVRTPKFDKAAFRDQPPSLGGRTPAERDRLSDVWTISTSSGGNGHGAQFPLALPARCIALTTEPGDLVLDPFVGTGTAGLAAMTMNRRFIGLDVSDTYLAAARERLAAWEAGEAE